MSFVLVGALTSKANRNGHVTSRFKGILILDSTRLDCPSSDKGYLVCGVSFWD